MNYLNLPVHYLERDDFLQNGTITNDDVPKNIPVVLMLQANFCPHCKGVKSEFQRFADDYDSKVFCATVQIDGDQLGEKELHPFSPTIRKGFRGYPEFVLFINGVPQEKNINGWKYQDMVDFIKIDDLNSPHK